VRRGLVVVCCALAATALGTGACSGEGGDLEAYCATARGFTVDNPAAAFGRLDPADPTGTSTALAAAAEQLRDWAAEAPREVRDDVEALAEAAADLADAFEPAGGDTVEDDPADAVDAAAVEEASGRVLEFTSERCEVDLDPGAPPG
jgi:hypothetical protein